MRSAPAPRYIATDGFTRNRINLALLYPVAERCGRGTSTCSCELCVQWRSTRLSPRVAQLMVESCDRIIDLKHTDQDALVCDVRERLPAMVEGMGNEFFLGFVRCFVSFKSALEMGEPLNLRCTADEMALHILLDEVSVRILSSGSAAAAIEVRELLEYLPVSEHDEEIELLRSFLLEDNSAQLLYSEELAVRDLPRRANPQRNLNWVPSFWFLEYTD